MCQTEEGQTALHLAAANGRSEAIKAGGAGALKRAVPCVCVCGYSSFWFVSLVGLKRNVSLLEMF